MYQTVKNLYLLSAIALVGACTTAQSTPDGENSLDCGNNTTLVNGICLADAVCGAGTTLVDGACVVDTECPEGSSPQGGVCVQALACADGTEEQNGECVATIKCGNGTLDQDGQCVNEAYGPPNVLFAEEQIAQSMCRGLLQCCTDDPDFDASFLLDNQEICEAYINILLENDTNTAEVEFYSHYIPQPYGTDAERFQEFLDSLEADADCTVSQYSITQIGASQFEQGVFQEMLVGTSPEGGICFDESTDTPSSSKSACADGLYCAEFPPEVESPPFNAYGCFLKGSEGASCEYHIQCEEGTHCATDICTPNPGLGGTCSEDVHCTDGFYCGGGSCVAQRSESQLCASNEMCENPLVCIDTQCKPRAQVGESCAGVEAEAGTLCVSTARCALPEETCVAYLAEGEICENDEECFSGSSCEDQDTSDGDNSERCHARINICAVF